MPFILKKPSAFSGRLSWCYGRYACTEHELSRNIFAQGVPDVCGQIKLVEGQPVDVFCQFPRNFSLSVFVVNALPIATANREAKKIFLFFIMALLLFRIKKQKNLTLWISLLFSEGFRQLPYCCNNIFIVLSAFWKYQPGFRGYIITAINESTIKTRLNRICWFQLIFSISPPQVQGTNSLKWRTVIR